MAIRCRRWCFDAGFIAACVLLFTSMVAAAPGAPHVMQAGTDVVALSGVMTYRIDPGAGDRPEDAFARAARGEFAPLPDGNPAFGFQREPFWFHATLINRHADEPRWLLVQEYALSDRLDLYLRYPDGRITHQVGGDHQPFDARTVRYRHPNFRIDLPQGQPVELLLRVHSESSMQVPLVLYTPRAFAELLRDAQFATGLYYGIVLALLIYNLVLWAMLRDASYLWYSLHVGAFAMVLFALNGYAFEYFWPDNPWLADAAIPFSICLALIGMQQFSRTYLDLPARWRTGNLVSLGVIGFFALLALASLRLPYSISTPLASRAVLLGLLWIIIVAIVMLRRGYRPARLFLLAWSLFLLGTAAFTLLAFGLVPRSFLTQYGVQIGSALEMLLLSLALGARYASLRDENIRVVQRANEDLERRVTDRTRQLRTTLAQLGEANVQLREYTRRDPLTGAYNRRYFHEVFDTWLRDDGGRGKPLALLLADLDHFKQINDRNGHLVGDECLRTAARRIEEIAFVHAGVVARFGGEEFVVVLPGADTAEAMATAEAIRARIAGEPVRSGARLIHLSISIGVHTLTAGPGLTPEDMLRKADAALYRAKAAGRNCVRHSLSAA